MAGSQKVRQNTKLPFGSQGFEDLVNTCAVFKGKKLSWFIRVGQKLPDT